MVAYWKIAEARDRLKHLPATYIYSMTPVYNTELDFGKGYQVDALVPFFW